MAWVTGCVNATKWSLRESKGKQEGPQSFRTSPLGLSYTTVEATCITSYCPTVLGLFWNLKIKGDGERQKWGGGVAHQARKGPSLNENRGTSVLCPAAAPGGECNLHRCLLPSAGSLSLTSSPGAVKSHKYNWTLPVQPTEWAGDVQNYGTLVSTSYPGG